MRHEDLGPVAACAPEFVLLRVGGLSRFKPATHFGAKRLRSDRQRDLAHNASEDKEAAQAVAVAVVRQEQAAEADERGGVTAIWPAEFMFCFPSFQPMTRLITIALAGLPEAFVSGPRTIGEKEEQSKN